MQLRDAWRRWRGGTWHPRGATLSRRSFLQSTALVSGWLAVSRLPLATATAAEAVATDGLQVLTPAEAEVLAAVGERIAFTGDPAMPAFHETAALKTIDQALRMVDDNIREQIGWLLWLFDYGPPVFSFRFARFTSLSPEEQDEYIRGWALSRLGVRRIGFQALKNLVMLGYYSQDATWKGIHYRGPWVPRPRRVIGQE